jgi:Na+/H+ antiporter NhaC
MNKRYLAFACFVIFQVLAFWAGKNIQPVYVVSETTIEAKKDSEGKLFYTYKGEAKYIEPVAYEERQVRQDLLVKGESKVLEEFVFKKIDGQDAFLQMKAQKHWGWWSLWPAFVAVFLCFLFKDPVTSLLGGIIAGSFLLGNFDITVVLKESIGTAGAAKILILYLWMLGGLMGIWARTGAAQAFASLMTEKFVRGPRSAKLVAWGLGVIFFQGGTMSTVLVGTTVKPIADKENISHEELSYIVDSTASPIASQLAFNAWPGYVQAFIFVSGVGFLATEADRISFFFKSVPFCFYAIFAVLSTFLLSIDKAPFIGKRMKEAIKRSRETGELDAPGSDPLSAKELETCPIPEGYKPHVVEFFLPLLLLIGIAIGTFIFTGSPQIEWAFGTSLTVAALTAMARGMSLRDLMFGVGEGLKGVVMGSVILLLAMSIGGISKSAGGGAFLVSLMAGSLQDVYWLLPLILFVLTIVIAFSTGTSWGTYAVTFPLAMPLAWAISQGVGMSDGGAFFFMTLCFAAVMDGSVFGDQCSPISDTTVLSAMCTGCDLMDHVKTQIPPASIAAFFAAILWTILAFFTH